MTLTRIPIEAIALDLEGTMIDLECWHFLAFEYACQALGIPLSSREVMEMPGAIGGGDRYIATQIALRSDVLSEHILEEKRKRFAELLLDHPVEARPGVLSALEWFRSQAIPLAIGSITSRADAEPLLARTRIDAFVPKEFCVLGDDIVNGRPKPAPDVYLETARRRGVKPAAQLVFEDSVPGVRAAREAGSWAIGMPVLPIPIAHMGLIEEGVLRVFHSWEEINLAALWKNLTVPGAAH